MPSDKSFFKPDFKHSYTRRCRSHDYRAPFIYHIILSKAPGCEDFGFLQGDARIRPGEQGCAFIRNSRLGNIIRNALADLQHDFPIVRIYQYAIMPDHLHILLRIMQRSEMHLGFYIIKLKGKIREEYGKLLERDIPSEDIFKPNYCDKPLIQKRSLDGLFRYIRENPHRLAMRRQFPQFFQRARKLMIMDVEYEAYGNLFLLRNPDKQAVKISRKFTPEEKEQKKTAWISASSQGTVLVSPFISKEEKAVRTEAEGFGAGIILITHEAFGERFKPGAHDFALCSEGRLLIITLGLAHKTSLTYDICQHMNALAEIIAIIDS